MTCRAGLQRCRRNRAASTLVMSGVPVDKPLSLAGLILPVNTDRDVGDRSRCWYGQLGATIVHDEDLDRIGSGAVR